jgi:hypothetical protein
MIERDAHNQIARKPSHPDENNRLFIHHKSDRSFQ